MSDRDCKKCKHHTKKGCDSWDCNFERRMARKEIIEMLKVLKEQALKSHNDTAIIDVKKDSFIYVMNVAINSLEIDERYELEYEQIEPCEDAISRQAVLDKIENSQSSFKNGFACGFFIEKIIDLPPVNPKEPKTGHWKPYLKEGLRYQCSVCDSRFATPWGYCPSCGAKMEESEASE